MNDYQSLLESLGRTAPDNDQEISTKILEQRGADKVPLSAWFEAFMRTEDYQDELEATFWPRQARQPARPGKTAIIVDLSRHMFDASKEITPADRACFLALALKCEEKAIFIGAESLTYIQPTESLYSIEEIHRDFERGDRPLSEWFDALNERGDYNSVVFLTNRLSPGPRMLGYKQNVMINVSGKIFKDYTKGRWKYLAGRFPTLLRRI